MASATAAGASATDTATLTGDGTHPVAGTVALSALWANVHGSFFLAFVLPLVYSLGWLAREFVWGIPSRREAVWFVLYRLQD